MEGSAVTPDELRDARAALGLSAEGFARLTQVQSGRTVRKWEAGERDIPGPVAVLVGVLLASAEARQHCGLPPVLLQAATLAG